ncbi:hypothetical protein WDU94_003190 [Cyamophila willieti]
MDNGDDNTYLNNLDINPEQSKNDQIKDNLNIIWKKTNDTKHNVRRTSSILEQLGREANKPEKNSGIKTRNGKPDNEVTSTTGSIFQIYLCECCTHVNELFKYYNLFSVTLIVYSVAFSVYYGLSHMKFLHYTVIVYILKLMLKFPFKLYLIVTFPHMTTSEVAKTREYLASIGSTHYPLRIKQEISLFWDDVTSKTIEFSACGFITLNTKFVVTAMAAGAANLIILFQFQKDVWTTSQ